MNILDNLIDNEYLQFLVIFIGTIIFVTISYLILRLIVKKIAGKKKNYGDFILKKLSKPLLLIVFFVGVYSSLKSLGILDQYYVIVDGIFFVIVILLSAVLFSNIITILTLGYLKVKKGFERTPGLLNKTLLDN